MQKNRNSTNKKKKRCLIQGVKISSSDIRRMMSLRLIFCYLKIIHSLHTRYHSKIIGYILETEQRNKCVYIHTIIIMKMKMKMKNKSHRYDINRPRSRDRNKYSKYRKCISTMMLKLLSNT